MYESKPDVGSSRNRTRGFVTRAIPMLVRLDCPPAKDSSFVTSCAQERKVQFPFDYQVNLPEIPRERVDPIRTFLQVFSASWLMTASTLSFFCCKDCVLGILSSAVYISISYTVRFSIRASAQATPTLDQVYLEVYFLQKILQIAISYRTALHILCIA